MIKFPDFSRHFPDMFQISWHFQVFQTSGHPVHRSRAYTFSIFLAAIYRRCGLIVTTVRRQPGDRRQTHTMRADDAWQRMTRRRRRCKSRSVTTTNDDDIKWRRATTSHATTTYENDDTQQWRGTTTCDDTWQRTTKKRDNDDEARRRQVDEETTHDAKRGTKTTYNDVTRRRPTTTTITTQCSRKLLLRSKWRPNVQRPNSNAKMSRTHFSNGCV